MSATYTTTASYVSYMYMYNHLSLSSNRAAWLLYYMYFWSLYHSVILVHVVSAVCLDIIHVHDMMYYLHVYTHTHTHTHTHTVPSSTSSLPPPPTPSDQDSDLPDDKVEESFVDEFREEQQEEEERRGEAQCKQSHLAGVLNIVLHLAPRGSICSFFHIVKQAVWSGAWEQGWACWYSVFYIVFSHGRAT